MSIFGRRVLVVVALLATLLAMRAPSHAAESKAPYVVIVNSANPITHVTRRFLTEVFLKKTTRWTEGDVIRPVDLGADSPTRQRFSEDVLRRSVDAVKSYWQQMVFSGRDVPPPELKSDDEVVKFVVKYGSSVGYVSGSTKLDGVKALSIE